MKMSDKMSNQSFKQHIDHLLKQYGRCVEASAADKAVAEKLRPHDPVLADLLIKNVDAAEDVYKHVFKKVESNK